MKCPLCSTHNLQEFSRDSRRTYYRCLDCSLIFVPFWQYLPREAEKRRYDLHQNSADNTGYRRFLNRLFIPLQQGLAAGSSGLDFGSGPDPVLSQMFKEAGHEMALFDYFYAPNTTVFDKRYNFICASEVVEHLHDPKSELERLWSCLKPGGKLGVMTHFFKDQTSFSEWYYKNDLTHVCFFSRASFLWLAQKWSAEPQFPGDDVVILKKKVI